MDLRGTSRRACEGKGMGGGDTVFLPEGRYRLEGMLTIASNVFLRGRWSPIGPDRPAEGTILMIHNQEHEQSVLITGSGCGVRDLTFWHPDQSIAESTAANSPTSIRQSEMAAVLVVRCRFRRRLGTEG